MLNPDQCKTALEDAYGNNPGFGCIAKASDDECLQAVAVGDATVTIAGGYWLYIANAKYGLAAIVAEGYSADLGDARYWGVALTKRSKCATVDGNSVGGPITGLDDSLRGMKACHTGYRKASGWYLPVGKLANKGIIDFSVYAEEAANHSPPVRADAETVEQFWDDNVCAPGTTANGPTVAGNLYGVVDGGGLCKLCKTDCTSSDPYAGYEGALSCMDQEGDIAFVKHSTVRNYDASDSDDDDDGDDDDGDDDDGDDDGDDDDGDDDGDDDDGDDDDGDDVSDRPPLTESDKSNYVGICDAGCMTLFNADGTPIQGSDGQFRYEKCSTGKLSSDAMVAKKSFVGSPEYNILMDALSLSNNTSAAVDAGDITEQQATALKQEGTVGLWSANTQLLYKITEPATDSGFRSFFTAYDAFKEIQYSERGGDGGSPSPSPPTSQSPSPSSSPPPSPFPLPSNPDATSSANVAYLMTLLGNPELTDSLKLEIQGDVVKEAKRACNAAGKSCPDASFTGAVECTADCGAVRRRLLASEVEVFGTLNNVAGGKAFEDYMSSLPEIGGRPVSGSSNFVAVGDASMVKMGLGGCMVLVLGLLLAMA